MDYYIKEFNDLQEEFHEVLHDYPLFSETIDDIYEKDIKEINELLEKNDEYYLKKAISKLKDIINYIKETSMSIKKEYSKFNKLANTWEKVRIVNVSDKELSIINHKVNKANELIGSHDLKDIIEANKIMESLLKDTKSL